MFETPLSQITFPMIEEFCKHWPEGVRVDYKKQIPDDVSKVVASFANTLGGILIIGVETTKPTNMPLFPIVGFPAKEGLEESITQACYMGIYPPVVPVVRVFPVPSQPNNVVIVVKVPESIEAPHAIQNTNRIYVRVNSTSGPYKDAAVDQIEYWIKRKQNPEARREQLIQDAFARSRFRSARIRIAICPRYPHKHILTGDSIDASLKTLKTNSQLAPLTRMMRRIQGGFATGGNIVPHYFEISLWGGLFYDEPLNVRSLPPWEGTARDQVNTYINLVSIVVPLGRLLRAMEIVLYQTLCNVAVKVSLEGISGQGFLPSDPTTMALPSQVINECHAIQDIAIAETDILIETARERFQENVTELVQQLMWAFDWDDESFRDRTGEILRANGLVKPN